MDARELAEHLLGGAWEPAAIIDRLAGRLHLPRSSTALRRLAAEMGERFPAGVPAPRLELLQEYLAHTPLVPALLQAAARRWLKLSGADPARWKAILAQWSREWIPPPPPSMQSGMIPGSARVAPVCTPAELARWLQISPAQLLWLADPGGREHRQCTLRFRRYSYRWIPKRRQVPGSRCRLIEHPRPILKRIQRQILTEILDHIPPHPAAVAFQPGKSPADCAARHVGRRVVLSIDLREFFPSIPIARVQACFRWLGYPEPVARLLTGLCANATPEAVLRDPRSGADWFAGRKLFGQRHLPQGAPTSPALSNLCCLGLDRRLSGLARRSGAVYTRYADDLVFSGDQHFECRLPQFRLLVNAIILDAGFEIRRRKTRVMRQGKQQRVLGVVVNRVTNIERREFDALKAELFNCVRFGPQGQNRKARSHYRQHLTGRVAWIASVHAGKGKRLRALLDQIDWSGGYSGGNAPSNPSGGSLPVE